MKAIFGTKCWRSFFLRPFATRVEKEELKVVGTPDISDLKFEPGQPIRFKADFEVAPEFEIADYRGLPVQYEEPMARDDEIEKRLDAMRENKAEYPNLDPRPIEDKDYVMVHLRSLTGLAEPIEQDVQIEVGRRRRSRRFNEALIGASPGDSERTRRDLPGRIRPGEAWPARRYVSTDTEIRPEEGISCAG